MSVGSFSSRVVVVRIITLDGRVCCPSESRTAQRCKTRHCQGFRKRSENHVGLSWILILWKYADDVFDGVLDLAYIASGLAGPRHEVADKFEVPTLRRDSFFSSPVRNRVRTI